MAKAKQWVAMYCEGNEVWSEVLLWHRRAMNCEGKVRRRWAKARLWLRSYGKVKNRIAMANF